MMKRCPICGLESRGASSFCPFDGQKLEPVSATDTYSPSQPDLSVISQAKTGRAEKQCPRCDSEYPARATFCPKDGIKLEVIGETSKSAASSATSQKEDEQTWDPDSLIGRTVATHYKLVEKIGQGGMGVVYKADHIRISRPAAIKILNPELAGDPEVVARFGREAEMASRLNHPNAVGIYDVGEEEDGLVYIAMEYVDGEQLSKIIEREVSLPVLRVANIIRQVAGALDAAHQLNIVHRDLKPDNIMICKRAGKLDWVKVVDFGIAKQTQHGFGYQSVTRKGLILGTPEYMAPEQLLRESLDSRTDVYSLGLVAYKMLTGKQPFTGKNSQARMVKKLTEQPLGFKQVRPGLNLSSQVEAVVMKAISREPEDRYRNTLEFSAALERAAGGTPLYDPAVEPLLQSASVAAGVPSIFPRPEDSGAQPADSGHQATIITFPQEVSESNSSSGAAGTFTPVKDTRNIEPSSPVHQPDSLQEDMSSWQATPAYFVTQPTNTVQPVRREKRPGWIFYLASALLLLLLIAAAVVYWRMTIKEPTPVAEEPTANSVANNAEPLPQQIEAQLPAQAEPPESLTVSAPSERAESRRPKETAREQSPAPPPEESSTRSATPVEDSAPVNKEAPKSGNGAEPEAPKTVTEEKPPEVVRRSRGVIHGSVIRRVEPAYPRDAWKRGIRGKVVVEVAIDEQGRVTAASVLSGPAALRETALRAAQRWRFNPTLLNGIPSKSSRTIEFNFVTGK